MVKHSTDRPARFSTQYFDLEPVHERLLVDFIFADEDFKQTAMNKSFPRTQDFTQSVRRQVQALIERKDAHNIPVSQDWKNISLVKNYVAE